MVVGVAAVDDDVLGFEEWDEGLQRRIDCSRRHHQPDGTGLFQLAGKVFESGRPGRPFFGERLYGVCLGVKNDAMVAGPHKTPHHIGSHPPQSDHAQFHVILLSREYGNVR